MRRSVLIAVVLVTLAFVLVGGPSLLFSPTTSEVAPETDVDHRTEMFHPTGGESGIWPYLNSRQAFEKRSPINVIVIGETDAVVQALIEARDRDWEETDAEQAEADPGSIAGIEGNQTEANESAGDGLVLDSTAIQWGRTTGASRFAYVDPGPDEDGRWVRETAQVHDGTYYGHRYHIRMYESPRADEPWVAIQTHSEYFDWFTLRHRVTGSQRAQMRLEADLMSLPQVSVQEDVRRVYLGNANASDADGWATVIDLIGVTAVGLVAGRRVLDRSAAAIDARLTDDDLRRLASIRARLEASHLLLIGTILALVLGVRVGGIALESTGRLPMHGIAVLLYPVVALGLPVGTYAIARGLERRLDAAVVASSALAVAFWLDFGFLGVSALSIDVIVQRALIVVALGLIAAGAARRSGPHRGWNDLLAAGAVLWTVVLGATLFGYL